MAREGEVEREIKGGRWSEKVRQCLFVWSGTGPVPQGLWLDKKTPAMLPRCTSPEAGEECGKALQVNKTSRVQKLDANTVKPELSCEQA